jgi:hypothetical protein
MRGETGKPRRGTGELRVLALTRVREYLTAGGSTRDGFLAWARNVAPRLCTSDLQSVGGYAVLAAEIRSGDIDVPLDFDDVPDTSPGTSALPARPLVMDTLPRQPEARELLELRREREKRSEAERRLKSALDALAEAEQRAGVVAELRAAEPPPIVRRERASGLREATAVVLCSDWHVEEVINPAAVDGRNAYGPEVARDRVRRLADGVLWLLDTHRQRFEIRELVLWLGGDLISGWIHEELTETNALSPIEATLLVQGLVTDLLRTLLAESGCERIVVPCSPGNHGRMTAKRRVKNGAETSYEWLIYHQLAQVFANEPRLDFQIANGPHLYLRVYDWTLRFHHGDHVNYWGGVGGITVPIRKALAAWESFRHADLSLLGHFHSYHDLRDFVVNGSLVGYSEYALSVKAHFEVAQQAFFLIDSKRFKCMSTPIWVTEEPC